MATCRRVKLDRKSGSAGMPRPISYAVFCLKKKSALPLAVHFFKDPPPTHTYPLSLHDALPISRFFVPEHGTMFTLALVRFPPTATKEIQYLNAKGALTYTDIAGDPVLYGNLPPREISMKDVFRSGDSSKKFKIAEG